jgi:hypothetical protein
MARVQATPWWCAVDSRCRCGSTGPARLRRRRRRLRRTGRPSPDGRPRRARSKRRRPSRRPLTRRPSRAAPPRHVRAGPSGSSKAARPGSWPKHSGAELRVCSPRPAARTWRPSPMPPASGSRTSSLGGCCSPNAVGSRGRCGPRRARGARFGRARLVRPLPARSAFRSLCRRGNGTEDARARAPASDRRGTRRRHGVSAPIPSGRVCPSGARGCFAGP